MLDKIKPNQADALQHRALMRLTLRTIGETHRIFYGFQAWLVDLVRRSADEEGNAQAANLLSQMSAIDSRFRRAVQDWVRLFGNAREQAASLPFGVLVIRHNAYMGTVQKSLQEDMSAQDVGTIINLWQRRRQLALQTAQQRVMGDGLNLDNRIWRLENDGINQIRRTLASAMAQRTNAYTLASALEDQLGADQDMPRWAEDRLYSMTARERAASRDGLITDPAMRGEGVSYKALRLARTELQFANHAVTTEIAQHSPWVTGRNVTLSQAHPKSDVCDGLVSQNPWPKDSAVIPAHPNCVTPGQTVATIAGDVLIEKIKTGDRVLTHTGQYKEVKATWATPHDGMVYEITTPCGRFELTGNHPVLLRRGWVNAEFVQLGDEVLHAPFDARLNLNLSETKNVPTLLTQKGIASDIVFDFGVMPSSAVALNCNHSVGQSDVDKVSTNLVFPFVDDSGGVQCGVHSGFQRAGIGETQVAIAEQHGYEAGVIFPLGGRDFASNVGALGGVILASEIKTFGRLAHFKTGGDSPTSVIFAPGDGNGFTHCTKGDIVCGQQATKGAEGQPVTPEDFWRGKRLLDVDVVEEFGNRSPELLFDSEGVKLWAGQSVPIKMVVGETIHLQPADRACNHDNLLSSSPDVRWGAESGNPGVGGVANPAQALMDYTTVTGVKQRHYTGLVYNMEVEGDHSYTVNSAAVHNCLCFWTEVLMKPSDFTGQVKGWLSGENEFLNDYQQWLGTRQITEPLPWDMSLADSLELWLSTGQGAQSVALGVGKG